MTITSTIHLSQGALHVQGTPLLNWVPNNIFLSPVQGPSSLHGAFLGASASKENHRHVFPLGTFEGHRFLCCFRFKIWWMTQRMGCSAKDLPSETQFLLVEVAQGAEQSVYAVFLPLLEGPFRATLQGNNRNELELCLESGDPAVQTSEGKCLLYIHSGTNPFEVISDAVKTVEAHSQTFRHREKKKMPGFLDWFGWCTWDAFYTDVTTDGIREGLNSLSAGGVPPGFLIIDDGWQSVATDQQPVTASVTNGASFSSRLTNIKENYKFQKDGKDGERQEDPALGLQLIVHEAKMQHAVKYIYVWHAITGYWGGVKPGVSHMEHYESALRYPVQSPGVSANEPDYALDIIAEHGLGLVHPNKVFSFFDELHHYLAAAGVDGVKVDVQNILETLGSGFGGRVSLARKYHQALETSISQNFPDNGCISCMSHNTDGLYSSKQTAVVRASDDFYPRDPASHTIHIASVAYNSLFLGEFMQPDWDMFQSLHPAADYHAAARAVGGCAIYVSDKPGNHNFELLRKLVLPDGSVLRAELPGRPARECLFTDPARDGESLLKIWNMNKCTGVLGVFNCQGAGWCRIGKTNTIHDAESKSITGSVQAGDVELIHNIAEENWNRDTVMYSHRLGSLAYLAKGSSLHVTLRPKEYEVFTVVPVKVFKEGVKFAPIGAIKMFNAGGAVRRVDYHEHDEVQEEEAAAAEAGGGRQAMKKRMGVARMRVRGCGLFGMYSSVKPKRVLVGSDEADFTYEEESGLATVDLPFLPVLQQNSCKQQLAGKGEDAEGECGHLWAIAVEFRF